MSAGPGTLTVTVETDRIVEAVIDRVTGGRYDDETGEWAIGGTSERFRKLIEKRIEARLDALLSEAFANEVQDQLRARVAPQTVVVSNLHRAELAEARAAELNTKLVAEKRASERWYRERGDKAEELAAARAELATEIATSNKLVCELRSERDEARAERDQLRVLLNTPQTAVFLESVRVEAVHQRERWGTDHDAGKEPQDWFWLIGYLAGKALRAAIDCDREKALHHTISTAAVLANWHLRLSGGDDRFRPGIEPPVADGGA